MTKLKNLFRKKYINLNKILINESALEDNHKKLQAFHKEADIAPILKSNAYGHGLKTVAPIFDRLNPPFLVVDSLYEAYELTKLKVKTDVLILGYTHPSNFSVKRLPFHITVYSLDVAKSLNRYQAGCKIHIFVDTGMCREGVPLEELQGFIQELNKLTNLKIVGLASHLADADNPIDSSFTQRQIDNYKKALQILADNNIYPKYRHISASSGAFKIKDGTFNIIRAGLASYGINPLGVNDSAHNRLLLKPVLSLTSKLIQIKTIAKGAKVGYNGTFTAKRKMKIGLLPLGYYEGVDRRLSNKGIVTYKGVRCKIIGRVSMNMTTIDISNIKNPQIGDEVVVYSDNPSDKNSLVNSAKITETIPYELLVQISESVKREIV